MKKPFYLFLLLLLPGLAGAQEEKKFGIEFSGFVKNDFSFDSRQTVSAREGHFLLWPHRIIKDDNDKDINASPVLSLLAIQSRLSGKITGPDAFGAKTSGLIEVDFFGTTNAAINLLRMRHAYVKLNWERSELLLGQYWNPLFVTSCFPSVVSFNTGAPIQPFSRNPQIRYTYGKGAVKVMAAALGQRDYSTIGANGASPDYLRNAAIPNMHLQLHYNKKSDEKASELTMGIGGEIKKIKPRISNTNNQGTFKLDESLTSMSGIVFATIKTKPITVKLTGIYGENLSDVLSITGFAVKEVTDTLTGQQSYTPTSSLIIWTDIQSNGKKWQVGLFAGMNKYLGTKEAMSNSANNIYSLPLIFSQRDITMLYRIAPRVMLNSGKTRFAAEWEYTFATFGETNNEGVYSKNNNGIPENTKSVGNIRILLAAYYFF